MGSLFKKKGSRQWQMGVCIGGRQVCRSAHTTNKTVAKKLLARWETEVFEGKFNLPRSAPPLFEKWAEAFLAKITHPNTKKRYSSSVQKLKKAFTGMRLTAISPERIEEFGDSRLAEGVEAATVNHDLRVLRRMLRLAERKQFIAQNPFSRLEFLKERPPRLPHIITFDEEEQILLAAPPFLRALVVLILETGMRSHREALTLKWDAVDFENGFIRVRESKTRAGIRNAPITSRCKAELLRWRDITGPAFSAFVFPNFNDPKRSRRDVRFAWSKTLKEAGLFEFPIYCCRHTFASRLSAAGVADLTVAQMIGHSSPGILQVYSKAIDDFRRDAVRKLEQMRYEQSRTATVTESVQ